MAPELPGTPSDEVEAILATGRTAVTTIFVSMSARHPQGRDLEYLEWHCYDHRPEQFRLRDLRGALRLVSTPACRAARPASDDAYDATDHVMTYLFADAGGLEAFNDLGRELGAAGRMPELLPSVERGVYGLAGMVAAPRVKVGADVLPWLPCPGVLLLVERGRMPATELAAVPGVAGAWWGSTDDVQLTYCFLDDDPVETAGRLRPALEARWADGGVVPLLAAPFHVLVPSEPGRYLP